MDLAQLRTILSQLVIGLKDFGTHEQLPEFCRDLGLPPPGPDGSKREKMSACFEALSDNDLPRVAENFLRLRPPSAPTRNAIQDILWADSNAPEISKKIRRDIAHLLEKQTLFLDEGHFERLLGSLWHLDDSDAILDFLGVAEGGSSLRKDIHQHVFKNPDDWSVDYLFDRLGAYEATDRRFALFLEGLISADVLPDETYQRNFAEVVNGPLKSCGVQLQECGVKDGYPTFRVFSTHEASAGRPKNLVFASSVKPDIRFRDAINNDIEIVTNADRVLVYDRPIPEAGLLWRELQAWWSETRTIEADADAKASLYRRLRESLPPNSPPQLLLFESFYRGFGAAVPGLPALIPEVWLHWDPKTVRERGTQALLRFRMDFLLLLPFGIRVVVEVDGKHHYAKEDGQADASRYGAMMCADRELKLAGYHVYRFGGSELQGEEAAKMVKDFFSAVFKRYGVAIP